MPFAWWNSIESISKLQTALAILVTVLGIATLTVKLRFDHLKKVADAVRAAGRTKLDQEIQTKTAEAIEAAAAAKAAATPKPLKIRLRDLLSSIDPVILPALRSGTHNFSGGITATQFQNLQMIAKESGAEQFISISPDVKMGVGMGPEGVTYGVKFSVDPKLFDDTNSP